jgi:pimeloyl-ACP methyl ester carboxylesterase
MASPRPGTRSKPHAHRPSPLAQQLPLVSGRWLLWSLAGVFGGGLMLVYLTLVLLFWQGQWQILFHPSRTDQATPVPTALPIQDIAFNTTQTGHPQLDGWFIPAQPGSRRPTRTILYLHSVKTGSLAEATPGLAALHQLGIDVFAFDYRGFGKTEFLHPSEESTREDSEAAWQYLTDTRHIPPQSIVIFGVGLGASLAADLAANHPDAAGVVFDAPEPDAMTQLRADPRSRWMPVRLLAHDAFDPDASLAKIKLPKLILISPAFKEAGRHYATQSADPKEVVDLPSPDHEAAQSNALHHFLNELPSK